MRMNLRVAIGAASALRALQLIDLRIYGSPGFGCLDQHIIPLPNGYPYPAGVSI